MCGRADENVSAIDKLNSPIFKKCLEVEKKIGKSLITNFVPKETQLIPRDILNYLGTEAEELDWLLEDDD